MAQIPELPVCVGLILVNLPTYLPACQTMVTKRLLANKTPRLGTF